MALTVAHLYFVKSHVSNLPHVFGHCGRTIAGETVSASTKDEMRADIVRLAKQLVDVATPVTDMYALLRLR
jgi:hypothetical protein